MPTVHSVPKRTCALVRWVDGPDEGLYNHDVDVKWIVNFNPKSPRPETYAIEWRQQPKPRAGWPVYNGEVLDVSADLQFLQTRMEVYKLQDEDPEFGRNQMQQSPSLIDVNSSAFQELLKRLTPQRPGAGARTMGSSQNDPPSEEKVCIGKSLWVAKQMYSLSRTAASPGRMVRPLLRQAFSRRRLINSTYAGQRRLVDGIPIIKKGLKKYQKMADIHGFVLERFPHLSQSSFGAIVNSFLGPKPNRIRQMDYVQESESEQDSDIDGDP